MSMITHSQPIAHHQGRTAFVRNAFASVMDFVRGHMQRMETRAELERLTDRELNDIGLCRADIDAVVNRRA